ncbi:MAG TPA: VTT domain-containing protein [Abditibacteriaceae bacterium]|jgi:membrane protein DedA with SNARE-associated domain
MEHTLEWAKDSALYWTERYGYGAVVPALLLDPGGVPWPWIFLMLLAGKAGLNVPLLMMCGFVLLSAVDHALYWVAAVGRRPLMNKIKRHFPKLAECMEKAETEVRRRGILAITLGRFLPIVGRWVGVGAGLADVPWITFAVLNAAGVAVTVLGFGLAAHLVGRKTIDSPWFQEMIGGAFILGTVCTVAFIAWNVYRARRAKALITDATSTQPALAETKNTTATGTAPAD